MNVRWTPEAEHDRLAIWTYLAAHDPEAARRVDHLFGEAAAKLTSPCSATTVMFRERAN